MHRHGPSCLEGPVSRRRGRWKHPDAAAGPGPGPEPGPANRGGQETAGTAQPIRWELVERVRREIAAGTYETPEKMEKALERLLEQLDKE
jgi:hypothetical protein